MIKKQISVIFLTLSFLLAIIPISFLNISPLIVTIDQIPEKHVNVNAISFPKIDRYPPPQTQLFPDFYNGTLTTFDPQNPTSTFSVLRNYDLSSYDLRDNEVELMHSFFNERTIWPDTLPSNFDPDLIISI